MFYFESCPAGQRDQPELGKVARWLRHPDGFPTRAEAEAALALIRAEAGTDLFYQYRIVSA